MGWMPPPDHHDVHVAMDGTASRRGGIDDRVTLSASIRKQAFQLHGGARRHGGLSLQAVALEVR